MADASSEIQGFRLSPQQRRAWRTQATRPRLASCMVRIDGQVDRAALLHAIRIVIRRHEILRTVFRLTPDMSCPLQMVQDPSVAAAWRWSDLITATPASVLQGTLVEGPAATLVMVLAAPVMNVDAMSFTQIVADVARAYSHRLDDDSASEVLQYADVAEWQNTLFEEGSTQPLERRWSASWLSHLDQSRLADDATLATEERERDPERLDAAA